MLLWHLQASTHHEAIKHGIEVGDGLPDITDGASVLKSLQDAGFIVEEWRDLAPASPVPWYGEQWGTHTHTHHLMCLHGYSWCWVSWCGTMAAIACATDDQHSTDSDAPRADTRGVRDDTTCSRINHLMRFCQWLQPRVILHAACQ